MTREEFLRNKIKSQSSLKDFAQHINMPYTTLMSILKNVGGASIDNVIKICKGLNISADDLAYYDSQPESYYYDPEVARSAEELRMKRRILFDATRDLTKEDINFVINMVDELKKREGK